MGVTPQSRGERELVVLYSFPHRLGSSGIGWTAWNQANELVRAGHEVHIVAASVDRPVPGAASVTTTLTVLGRRVPHRAFGRDNALAVHDARAARRVAELEPDVVHAWPLASARTLTAAARAGVAGVREVPNTHTEHAYEVVADEVRRLGIEPDPRSSHATNPTRLALEEREWDAATALLVPSEPVAETFRVRGFDDRRLLRHRYGSDSAPYARSRPADAAMTAVFLGRVEPRKGLHHALAAWRASSASAGGRFLVYGPVEERYAAFLAPLLAQPGVEVRGTTDDPMRVLSEADVLLLPSLEEGSALVTYEAQVAGCVPLVSTAAGAVIDEGVTGLTHRAGDVETLTAQLDALAADPERLRTMQASAQARARELSWAAAVEATVAAYRAAIARREMSADARR